MGAALGRSIPLSALQAALGELAGVGIEDLDHRPAWQPIGVLLTAEHKRCIDEGRSPDGTPFLPLKYPRNRARDKRARGGTGQKPLQDTGLLKAAAGGGAGFYQETGNLYLQQSVVLAYAAAHQFGVTVSYPERRRAKPWVFEVDGRLVFTRRIRAHTKTIPARPFMGINDQTLGYATEILQENAARQYAAMVANGLRRA